MSLLDRFKNKKEKELTSESPKKVETVEKKEKKTEKEGEKTEKKETTKAKKVLRGETTRVIVAPVVTEKAAHLAEKNTYVFRVQVKATRVQVASAFKELYGVQPVRVNMVNLRAEPVRFGRSKGRERAWKKAYITTPKGKSIQVYEGV